MLMLSRNSQPGKKCSKGTSYTKCIEKVRKRNTPEVASSGEGSKMGVLLNSLPVKDSTTAPSVPLVFEK